MPTTDLPRPGAGANQHGLRDHNARLILSLIQRQGALPGSEIARLAGLSPQTVSVILRELELDGFLMRGDPQRGRVGKPSVPMALAPDAVHALGLKLGLRSADLVLCDFLGAVKGQIRTTYRWPVPDQVFAFLRDGLARLTHDLTPAQRARIAGIGIARPHEIWTWHDAVGAPPGALDLWQGIDFAAEIARFSPLPVFIENDATAASRAEHVYGRGRAFRDFAYFFVGSFVGGGIVLNHSVMAGATGNAGAFGSLPSRRADGTPCQLIDAASIWLLEAALARAGVDPARLWTLPQDWSGFGPVLDTWLADTADAIAAAAVTVCAVVDFEAIIVDGGFPPSVRAGLVARIRDRLSGLDRRGLSPFAVHPGEVGGNARAIGAACTPIFSRHLLNTHAPA
jgi:predicted NBD/HSP70 family sugar kinase